MKQRRAKTNLRVSYAKAVFGKGEIASISAVLSTPMIVAGSRVKAFETEIAKLFGKRYGVMTNSGSSANLVALELLRLPEGSEVITPALTFGTTLAPLIQKRLTPVLADVEEGNYQINVDQVERLITRKTRALMVPSLIGNIPDYARLRRIANKHHLCLIEDSCDTLGAALKGKPTGTYSDISTTSFYGSHIITAAGSGGMICFNRKDWYERAKTLVGWGRSSAKNETEDPRKRFGIKLYGVPYDRKFIFEEVGYNFQSTDINAAFGLAQLKRLKDFSNRRKKNFTALLQFFEKYERFFILPRQNPEAQTPWLAFPLTIRANAPFRRIELVKYLEVHNIQTRPIFTGNVLRQPAFRPLKIRTRPGGYPIADQIMRNAFLIGCHQGLTLPELHYMQEVLGSFLKRYTKR